MTEWLITHRTHTMTSPSTHTETVNSLSHTICNAWSHNEAYERFDIDNNSNSWPTAMLQVLPLLLSLSHTPHCSLPVCLVSLAVKQARQGCHSQRQPRCQLNRAGELNELQMQREQPELNEAKAKCMLLRFRLVSLSVNSTKLN